jgi:hypothetical protein
MYQRQSPGLSARSRRILFATAEALLCDEDEHGDLVKPPADACSRAVESLSLAVASSSPDLRRGYGALTFALEMLPLFVIGTPARMSRLPLARRVAYLEALETSRVGLLSMLMIAIKIPLLIPAFEEGAELASTGFDRPSLRNRRALALTSGGPKVSP